MSHLLPESKAPSEPPKPTRLRSLRSPAARVLKILSPASLLLFSGCVREEPQCSVRPTPGVITGTGCGDCEATELWSRDTRKGQEYLLVRGRVGAEAEKIIADIQAPVFSPDFGTVYFLSAAWAVSSAVHKVDIRSRTESFVIDGNSVFVIRTGPLRGMLLVDRALIKSDQNGNSLGRRSYLWLVSSDGKPIREIGDLDHPAVEQRRRALLDGHEDKPNQ